MDSESSASEISDIEFKNMSWMSHHDKSKPLCYVPLSVINNITLAIGIFLMITTLIFITFHRRLRKQHYILPYNLVLSDLIGAITFVVLDVFDALDVFDVYIYADSLLTWVQIIFEATLLLSQFSIVLIAVYQFITIRLDPFGARNIITTPRLVVICLLMWLISFAICWIITFDDEYARPLFLAIYWTGTVITGVCYSFIYRSIAKVPCGGALTQERKNENQNVLRTFGLVLGTTVLCWICSWVEWSLSVFQGDKNICLTSVSSLMIHINWIANCIIYWWRLKEFRSMFKSCRKCQGTVDLQII